MSERIPFCLPDITEQEIEAVVETLRSGWLTTASRSSSSYIPSPPLGHYIESDLTAPGRPSSARSGWAATAGPSTS
jgi:hypothetical protein